MKGFIFAFVLISFAPHVFALDANSYFKLKSIALGADMIAPTAKISLNSYMEGAAMALNGVAILNEKMLPQSNGTFICLPSVTILTAETYEAAVNIGLNEKKYKALLGENYGLTEISVFGIYGLSQMFPCQK